MKLEGEIDKAEVVAKTEINSKAAVKTSNANTEKYTVKAGDSLTSIAARVGISIKELAELNDLSPRSSLQRGQTILVPKRFTEYKVKRGDTLIGLASKYGLQSQELAEMNDLKPSTTLRIGDVIKVPNL